MSDATTVSEKCNICFEKFTTSVRARIQCPFCPSATCKTCLQQYLLSLSEDSHCMGCKREWNREFLDIHLPATFRKGPLRLQRRKVLVEREMAMLPSMQVYVEATVLRNKAWQKYKECGDSCDRLTIERSKLDQRISVLERQMNSNELDIPKEITELIARTSELQKAIHEFNLKSRFFYNQYNRNLAFLEGREAGRQQARQFIMKCPGNGEDGEPCRGFLSSQWKCGTCQKYFCNECHVLLGERNDVPHTCNDDAKATAALIRKDTRPCPKCGIRISKIEGCFAKDTPILLWNGHYSKSQDIKVGDILIGDDGEPRVVETLLSGGDEMYEVSQGKGMSYVVNSKHKLALKFSGEKSIHWSDSEQAWKVRWFDRDEHIMKSKKQRVDAVFSKEEAYAKLKTFVDSLVFDDVIEITVDDYMKLPEPTKKHLMGFKSSGVKWLEKKVPLDPYLFGLWIGDGINDGMSFALNPEADPEILHYLLKWCEENKAELVHDEAYRFRIRRREVTKGRFAIGRGATTVECKGCKEKVCSLCDLPDMPYTEEVEVGLRHPLKEQLEKYHLPRKAKYIPIEYLTNTREVRLQLLAGIIDTDGYLGNDGKRIQIPQANHVLGKDIEYLARSLGFAVNVDLVKKSNISFPNIHRKDYPDHYRVNISGEHLSEIPTRIARKRCVDSNSTKDELRTAVSVKAVGQGTYYGWSVSGGVNKRFLLGDFTVARNCDQMWCTSCQTTFSWNTGQILHNVRVHNPHYYEYLRRTGGNVPREMGDIPCGGIPDYYAFIRNVRVLRGLTQKEIDEAVTIHRSLSDISQVRLPDYPLRRPANDNRDLDVAYLLGNLTKDEWARQLEMKETKYERKKEIGLVLQTLVHVGAEKLTEIVNYAMTGADGATGIRERIKELNQLRDFSNNALKLRGEQMGIVVPQIEGQNWTWGYTRRRQPVPVPGVQPPQAPIQDPQPTA